MHVFDYILDKISRLYRFNNYSLHAIAVIRKLLTIIKTQKSSITRSTCSIAGRVELNKMGSYGTNG